MVRRDPGATGRRGFSGYTFSFPAEVCVGWRRPVVVEAVAFAVDQDDEMVVMISKLPWTRIVGEGLLIIISVYLAIFLEGVSQEREARASAHLALVQMLGEMRKDATDVEEIRKEQLARSRQYEELDEWLANPDAMPQDSVAETLDLVFFSNRTLYPRRSAWTTMLAAGQLAELDSPGLVLRLGDFYESLNARIVDNGNDYDESVNDIARNSAPDYWDGVNRRVRTTDAEELTRFRNQLRYLHISWNIWYLDLLDEYQQASDSLIEEIEAYLAARNLQAES